MRYVQTADGRSNAERLRRVRHRLHPPAPVEAAAVRAALDGTSRFRLDGERCPTCYATIRSTFCRVCGERRPSRWPQSIVGFLRASTARILDADNRLYRALLRLMTRPGELTVAFLEGRRRPFMGPLQLFATINIAYFLFATTIGLNTFHTPLVLHVSATNFYHQDLAQRWVNERIGAPEGWSYREARRAARSQANADSSVDSSREALRAPLDDFEAYASRFDRQAEWLSKSLIFVFIPAFALWFWLLYPFEWGRHRRGGIRFLVQGTHVWGAILIVFMASSFLFIAARLAGVPVFDGAQQTQEIATTITVGLLFVTYVTCALYRTHDGSGRTAWVGAALRAVLTFGTFIPMIQTYRILLFVIGFSTT